MLDVFTCPLTGSCLNLSIADVLDNDANSRSCATGYTNEPSVPFCAYCVDNYIKENNECVMCKAVRAGTLPILIAVVLGAFSTIYPAWEHWRECVAVNPAFPPSAFDFFLRGQTTSLPGTSSNMQRKG